MGWGIYSDLSSGAVFSLDEDLNVSGIIASMAVSESQMESQMFVKSATFTVAGNELYSGFMAVGNVTLTIGSKDEKFELAMSEDGTIEYGHIISAINLDNNTSSTKKYSTTHSIGNYCFIKSMEVKGDALLIAGSFNTKLAFDSSKESVSTNDLYLAVLNKSSLEVTSTVTSKVNEGEQNQKNEEFGGMTICGDYAYMIGYTADAKSHVAETPLAFWVNISNGTMTQSNPANLTTGVAALGTKLATAQTKVANDKLENIFSLNEVTGGGGTGISSTEQGAGVSVYPNPVVDVLNFTTPCNVAVINLMGVTVKQAENVSNLNVSDLINGQYIVKVTTEDGTSTVKVIKK